MINHQKKFGETFVSKKPSNENKESVGGIQSGRSPAAFLSGSPAFLQTYNLGSSGHQNFRHDM